jgi:phosphoribosylaminoimidazole carboxylase PurE protein
MDTMRPAAEVLGEFGVPFEIDVVSAHRTPLKMVEYAKTARDRGLCVIIAGAGGAAHLPGMVASLTTVPIIGVPVPTRALSGVDSLYSIVQMPAGIPVATVAIGNSRNAGILAVQILSLVDPSYVDMLENFRQRQSEMVEEMSNHVRLQFPSA